MNKFTMRLTAAVLLLALMAGSLAACIGKTADIPVQPMAEGDTNLTNLVLSGDLTVGDDTTLGDDLAITGDLDVTGSSELDGGITVDDTAFIVADTSGNVTTAGTLDVTGGVSELDGGITVDDTAFIVANTTGNTTVAGTLIVSGTITGTGNVALEGTLDVGGTLEYGGDDLNPVGYASSGQQIVYGTTVVTATAVLTHGLTTVTFCLAVLAEDPSAADFDSVHTTVAIAGNVCTAKNWQDDMVTASDDAVWVSWLVIGVE